MTPLLGTFSAGSVRGFRGQAQSAFVSATGGTITTSGNYRIHTFTGSANFIVSSGGTVEVLLVGGGGGGGSALNTGTGGAGGG